MPSPSKLLAYFGTIHFPIIIIQGEIILLICIPEAHKSIVSVLMIVNTEVNGIESLLIYCRYIIAVKINGENILVLLLGFGT